MVTGTTPGPWLEGTGHHRAVDNRPAARAPRRGLGWDTALTTALARRRRTPQNAPTQRTRHQPSHGIGQGATRPCRALAPGDGDALPAPGMRLGASTGVLPPRAPPLPECGATTTTPPPCEGPSRPDECAWREPAARVITRSPPRTASGAGPGTRGHRLCLPRTTPGNHAAPSNPTLRLSRARKRERSGRCRASAAAGCSARPGRVIMRRRMQPVHMHDD
jgi:hypothetical protein